ncbi:hypothetical protein [Caniella muris]|uniref:hypothetical protein n=1 Tax=Caniella muris TaxID=2941502 RepID=UPI00203EA6EF|nr:hypothetical protein [Caniella muris]
MDRTIDAPTAPGGPAKPIGRDLLTAIVDHFEKEARYVDTDTLEPGEPVFRVNDAGYYVTEEEWYRVWALAPEPWWERAWMITDNGQYDFDEVAAMTVAEVEAAYADPRFVPDVAFYTEVED